MRNDRLPGILTIVLLSISLVSCNSSQKKPQQESKQTESTPKEAVSVKHFPDLVPGEVNLDESVFGDIVELHGGQVTTNQIMEIKETELIVSDSLLIVKNLSYGDMFMAFSLPDFKFIKSFGKRGGGPGEFSSPTLVKTEDPNYCCFIYEQATNNLFPLNKNLKLSENPVKLPKSTTNRAFNDKQIYSFSDSDFVYAESVPRGKALFRYIIGDSVENRMIHNLAFSEQHKSWASYIGDFGANKEKKRMVFAYKYFKRIVFMDTEGKNIRTLIFDSGEAKRGDALAVMSPENITHYWGISAQEKYVYLLYSGRAPVDVTKEWAKKNYYIFVEQYDWNGNPVKKYKLDNWGYFTVDEKRGKLYLASVNDAEPFFVYDLPKQNNAE